jgi:small redox-active disulfide protein 2
MLIIKVLGSGCANCKKLEAITRSAVSEMGIETEIVHVTEYPEIMKYNVMSTPGLVINEKLVSSGSIPPKAEITTFLVNALEAA